MEIIVKSQTNGPYKTYVFSIKDTPENLLWFGGTLNFKGIFVPQTPNNPIMGHLEGREELIREKLQEIADIIYKDIP